MYLMRLMPRPTEYSMSEIFIEYYTSVQILRVMIAIKIKNMTA
jgi:hypothetical protein